MEGVGGLAHTIRNGGDSERDRPTELERPATQRKLMGERVVRMQRR